MNELSSQVRIAIVGWGREGQSAGRFLSKRLGKMASFTVFDTRKTLPPSVKRRGFHYILGKKSFVGLKNFDLLVRTPSFSYLREEFQDAKKAGVALTSPTNLFFAELVKAAKKPFIVGVTGTKGKGTTASLLYSILRAAKKKVLLAGNIGIAMLDILEKAKHSDFVILELSSFQLHDLQYAPDLAIVLPISPDHLDHHKSMAEYVGAKRSIAENQKKGDCILYFKDNKYSKVLAQSSLGRKLSVGRRSSLFKEEDIQLLGEHNFRNAIAAAKAAEFLGIKKDHIRQGVKSFPGLEHRLEKVRILKRKGQSITFINDSMSTNPATACAAIKSMKDPSIWIAGGRAKTSNYHEIKVPLQSSTIKKIILFGENKELIARSIGTKNLIRFAHDLKDALKMALREAEEFRTKKLTILFSPASSSFDMFKDAYDRGNQFKKLVRKLRK